MPFKEWIFRNGQPVRDDDRTHFDFNHYSFRNGLQPLQRCTDTNFMWLSDIGNPSRFWLYCLGTSGYCFQRLLNYLAFQPFLFGRLFQKRAVCSKFDIYVFIATAWWDHQVLCFPSTINVTTTINPI
jgi:hypothetical protein